MVQQRKKGGIAAMKGRLLQYGIIGAVVASVAVYGCSSKDSPATPAPIEDPSLADINFRVPQGWDAPVYNFSGNPLTVNGFKLGRKLFFETRLSSDNLISCGSCHQPFAAFSQFGHDVSHGVDEKVGVRNSPALFNLNWHTSFFWDGGVIHMELQPAAPITNPDEMNETLQGVLTKLQGDATYRQLFKEAFGDEQVTTERVFKSISQFMGLMVSANSRYDKYKRNEAGGTLSAEELDGLSVFQAKCASCHKEPLFSDFTFRNNGLALKPNKKGLIDSGRGHITPFEATSLYRFKVPSLRNLKFTPPYMHDGRFETIDQVLDHYTSGIQQTPNLDPLLASGSIALSATERNALKAFLNTLNDEEFVKDPRFQEPR
ncbi:cytochrome-c peroxidase [Taibaiella chishuiensis]|uniref:Cytochrome c peroxidase n=1 Tax=Taibaiella chishuiensis TaxID=1434707 RepID=A0A2P8CVS3_9BACT|nr:cytochrome c peroxidase [Taibaiella chishuiensis]PSK89057.1 cytochrome c peroxidase [Taibaiella chishuiensis]